MLSVYSASGCALHIVGVISFSQGLGCYKRGIWSHRLSSLLKITQRVSGKARFWGRHRWEQVLCPLVLPVPTFSARLSHVSHTSAVWPPWSSQLPHTCCELGTAGGGTESWTDCPRLRGPLVSSHSFYQLVWLQQSCFISWASSFFICRVRNF